MVCLFRLVFAACLALLWPTLALAADTDQQSDEASAQLQAKLGTQLPWYEATTWNTADGLPQNSVHDVVQTRDGYLWLATSGGLVRFDGIDFEVFDLARKSNPGSNRIRALLEDNEGTLWIGTEDGPGLARLRDGKFTTINVGQQVHALHQHSRGGVWAGGAQDGGLGRVLWVRNDEVSAVIEGELLDQHSVTDLQEDANGHLFIAAQVFARWDGKKLHEIACPNHVSELEVDHQGRMWVTGPRTPLHLYQQDKLIKTWQGEYNGILIDQTGTIWLGSESGPARLVNGEMSGTGESLSRLPGPLDKPFWQDREGNIWFGDIILGLVRLRRCRISGLTKADGLVHNRVNTVLADQAGSLMIGNADTLLGFDGSSFKPLGDSDFQRASGGIQGLLLDHDNVLWVAKANGIYRLADGQAEHIVELPGYARIILEDRQRQVWVGGTWGLLRLSGPDWSQTVEIGGLASNEVYCLAEDQEGNLWAGEMSAVTRLGGDETVSWTRSDGFPPGAVREIIQAPDGAMWFGTYGGGLCRLWDGKIRRVTTEQGLWDNSICRILQDDNGFVYINSNRGVFRTSWVDLNSVANSRTSTLNCISYGVAPGMATNEGQGGSQPSGCRTPDGKLWFATIEGLVCIDTQSDVTNAHAPAVVLSQIVYGGKTAPIQARVELPVGERAVAIQYAALSFSRPENVHIKYRLQGRDADWTSVGTERVARYSGLAPGTYRFQVIAANEDGIWNESGANFDLVIPARFYETRWFLALAIGSGLVVLVLAIRWRIRQFSMRSALLEQRVSARTAELREARDSLERRVEQRTEELAAANLSLQQDMLERERLQQQLLQSQKLETVGRLAGGIAHDFNNLLTVILGQAELAQLTASDEKSKARLNEIYEAGQHASKLSRQLLTFARGQRCQRGPVDLGELIRNLQRMLVRLLKENVKLKIEIADDLGCAVADSTQLEQVLINLCLNADDAMPEGGLLSLAVRNKTVTEPRGPVPPGEYIQVCITDTGMGMDQATQSKIFEPFFTTKEVGKGSGLGLAVCYGIVQNSDGHIGVRSEPDCGTVFEVLLPRSDASPEQQVDSTASTPEHRGASVLLVEDDLAVRQVVERMLHQLEFEIHVVDDGQAAVDFAANHSGPIDVLLTDVVMPGVDGVQVAERVRTLRPETSILFMSGYAERNEAESNGVDSNRFPPNAKVLAKPFSLSSLGAALYEVLSSSEFGRALLDAREQ